MNQSYKETKIKLFWEWFQQMEKQIKAFFTEEELVDKEALIEAINNKVLDFGTFSWQIGPGKNKPYYFTISPNGNPEWLRVSRQIVRAAPELRDWEFNHAKPAADWSEPFVLYDDFMMEQTIDPSDWEFVLLRSGPKLMKIILSGSNLARLDLDTRLQAATRIIINTIGEEHRINYISKIEVVEAFGEKHEEKAKPLAQLRTSFLSWLDS